MRMMHRDSNPRPEGHSSVDDLELGDISIPPSSALEMHDLRLNLRFDYQLGRQQTLRLILCRVRSVHNVGDKLRPERQHYIVAVDKPLLSLIYKKEVIAALAYTYINVLAYLDVAFGAQDE